MDQKVRTDSDEEWYAKYRDLLYRVAFSNVKNKADAEDAVQEVFIRYLRRRPVFENSEHEKAWMLRTVINICKDLLKSVWHKRTVSIESVSEAEKQHFYVPYVAMDDTLWMVMELPGKYRNALYLFYYEDYSIREISEILKLPEATVKTHLRRGREAIRQRLEAQEGLEGRTK